MANYTNRPMVIMIATGNWKDGKLTVPPFILRQAESLQAAEYGIFFTIVDDRTSVRGILRNIRRIYAEVQQVRPRLIHVQYGSITAAIGNLVRGSLPLIVSFCGSDLLGSTVPGVVWRIRESFSRAIGLWAARQATTIIVKSQNLFQALPVDLQAKAVVLPNGIDTDFFRPMDQNECRATLDWCKKSKIILFDGSWNGLTENNCRKNPALARATIDLLAKSIPDIYLHMMSNVPHKEVPLMMNAADCLLVTSLQEGSPNIIKEAMACNLPVVSVPCGDAFDRLSQITPGGIRPYDAAALASCVQEVIFAGGRSNGREQLIAQGLTSSAIAKILVQRYLETQEVFSNGSENCRHVRHSCDESESAPSSRI